jgi:hypothetical protein
MPDAGLAELVPPVYEVALNRRLCRMYLSILPLLAISCSSGLLRAQPVAAPLELRSSTNQVGRYEKIEFEIHGLGDYESPFDPGVIDARLEFTDAKGQRSTVPAFHLQPYERRRIQGRDWFHPVGSPLWKARFAPMTLGRFEAVAVVKDVHGERRSPPCAFECVPSSSKGFLRVSGRDPRFLEFNDGQPFFAIGQNLAFIGSGQYMTLSRAEETFGRLAANGANYLRIWTGCEDWALALEARKSAWDRSWSRRAPVVPIPDDPARKCLRLEWWDTRTGEILTTHRAEADQEGLRLVVPPFRRDLAVKIQRQ